MEDLILKSYHRLPAPARSVVGAMRGFMLSRRRYGPETEHLTQEALERDFWTSGDWEEWRAARLQQVLSHAAERVPYYRDYWESRRRAGKSFRWRTLEDWPLLEKEAIRLNPRAFVADGCDTRRMHHVGTSGTTGTPLHLWRTRETERRWYALCEARLRCWWGLSRRDRWANIGGRLVTPVQQRKPPFWIWDPSLRQLYMSSYHLAPELTETFLDALEKYRVRYLVGYCSSLHTLALAALRVGRHIPGLVCTLSNAEPLLPVQRETIRNAFNCPAIETYGMAEIVAGASQCEAGRLHFWPDAGVVEVFLGDTPAPPGEVGDLVCTGLSNVDMPLIRYRLGDRGAGLEDQGPCKCGRRLPTLLPLEGRSDDTLFTRDGRRVGRLDPVFKTDLAIREAQIIQEALDCLRVLIVPAPGFSSQSSEALKRRIRDRMGDVQVRIEEVERIPRGSNGKFQAVLCSVPREQLGDLAGMPPHSSK